MDFDDDMRRRLHEELVLRGHSIHDLWSRRPPDPAESLLGFAEAVRGLLELRVHEPAAVAAQGEVVAEALLQLTDVLQVLVVQVGYATEVAAAALNASAKDLALLVRLAEGRTEEGEG